MHGELQNVQVEVGEYQLSGNDENEELRSVQEIIIHPDYNETNKANDIALLRIFPLFVLDNVHSVAVCMPEMDKNFTGYIATATGLYLMCCRSISINIQYYQCIISRLGK